MHIQYIYICIYIYIHTHSTYTLLDYEPPMTFMCSSQPAPRGPPSCFVQGVVVATGMETRIGEIAKMMASEDKEAMEKAMEKSRPSGRLWEFYSVNFVVFFFILCICIYMFFGSYLACGGKQCQSLVAVKTAIFYCRK